LYDFAELNHIYQHKHILLNLSGYLFKSNSDTSSFGNIPDS